jgi:hypothetical protein
MAASQQLRLVTDPPPAHHVTADPVRQVFEHWVFMFGLHPGRTKLDHLRRQAINAALSLYDGDVQTIMLAVDGMASAPLGDKPESMQDAMREVDWFLGNAKRIERCLRHADVLAELARAQDARQAAPHAVQAPADPAAVAAARERLRAIAMQRRGAHG